MSSPYAFQPNALRGTCARLAIFAALLVFVWTAARIHYACGGNWTAVFVTGQIFNVPPDLEPGTYRVGGGGYDGQFYRYLAHDPSLRKGYYRFVDSPQLRFRRLLVPLSAWLLAFGQQRLIESAYIAVELLFVALGVYWCSRLLARRGQAPYWGLLFVVVPATLASFDRMLVDGPLAALFAGFLLYCEEKRWTLVWLLAMLACLTRETGLLLVAALVTDRFLDRDWRRALWYSTCAIPVAVWYGYLAAKLPRDGRVTILDIPVWGLMQRLFFLRHYPEANVQLLLRVTDILAVLGLAASIVLAVRWAMQNRLGPVTLCIGFFAALALLLGAPPHMLDAFGFGRPVSPLLLWVMLEAVSRNVRKALVPPLLVSLSVSLVFGLPFVMVVKGMLGR